MQLSRGRINARQAWDWLGTRRAPCRACLCVLSCEQASKLCRAVFIRFRLPESVVRIRTHLLLKERHRKPGAWPGICLPWCVGSPELQSLPEALPESLTFTRSTCGACVLLPCRLGLHASSAWALPALPPSPPSCLQVQRAKKCLDFAGTILLIHLAAVWCFSGFPRHAAW